VWTLRRALKLLHELGAAGVVGAFVCCIALIMTSHHSPLPEYAVSRESIAVICRLILVPSLAVVLISGLLGLAANPAFHNAGWVWVKALLGISMFEGTLLTVAASARHAAELTRLALAGDADPLQLAALLRTEWGGLWLLLTLSIANIVLGVWRPRFSRTPS
jgi:hypothetical protein